MIKCIHVLAIEHSIKHYGAINQAKRHREVWLGEWLVDGWVMFGHRGITKLGHHFDIYIYTYLYIHMYIHTHHLGMIMRI